MKLGGIMMKVVIAPDSFKESASAIEVANIMEETLKKISPSSQTKKIPLADGGEGMVDAVTYGKNSEKITHLVTGPLGRQIEATYGILNEKVAMIEMAAASGLDLLAEDERDPMKTTTYGFGELILHALDRGVRTFYLGIGGSATNDGGIGMAQALGVSIRNEAGESVAFGGEGLLEVADISLDTIDERVRESTFYIATDVTNPLTGKDGASFVYGPQKGATDEMIEALDQAMKHYGRLLSDLFGFPIAYVPGAGAAGGLGAACLVFLQAELQRGIDVVCRLTGLEEAVRGADLVFTGEGKIDDQTLYGKTVIGVAEIAKKYDVPVYVIAGVDTLTTNDIYDKGVTAVFAIADRPLTLAESIERTEALIEKTMNNLCRTIFTST